MGEAIFTREQASAGLAMGLAWTGEKEGESGRYNVCVQGKSQGRAKRGT